MQPVDQLIAIVLGLGALWGAILVATPLPGRWPCYWPSPEPPPFTRGWPSCLSTLVGEGSRPKLLPSYSAV